MLLKVFPLTKQFLTIFFTMHLPVFLIIIIIICSYPFSASKDKQKNI